MITTAIVPGRTYYNALGEALTVIGVVPWSDAEETSRIAARWVGAPDGDNFVLAERGPRTKMVRIAETLFRRNFSEKLGDAGRVQRTGITKLCADWKGNLTSFLVVGDAVDEALFMHCLEVVPPACNAYSLMQMGEPMDHGGPDGRPRFVTFQRHGSEWVYTGVRTQRESAEIV